MTSGYEHPKKKELRERCRDALDAAGFVVSAEVDPIPYKTEKGLQLAINPDVEYKDSEGNYIVCIIRTDTASTIPGWIVQQAQVVSEIPHVYYALIVENASEEFEASCRAVGIGLLVLRSSMLIELRIDPKSIGFEKRKAGFEAMVASAREELREMLDLYASSKYADFAEVQRLINGMPVETRSYYTAITRDRMSEIRKWGDEIFKELDAVYVSQSEKELEEILVRIQRGPVL